MIWLILGLAILIAVPIVIERRKVPVDGIYRNAAPGEFVQLSDGVTHYRWLGQSRGPLVVCVHGLTTPSRVWEAVADDLGGLGYRVLVYDLYGRGFSDRVAGPHDEALFLRQLDDLLDAFAIRDDITLIGYSMGGVIATAFAAQNPGRLRRLILLAPAGMTHQLGRIARFMRDTPVVGDWLALALFSRAHSGAIAAQTGEFGVVGVHEYQLDELKARGFIPSVLASLRGILAQDMEPAHRSVSRAGIPVLAIWGSADSVIPISALGQLAQWNRTARHEEIEGAGHGLPYTHHGEIAEIIRKELTQV